VVAAEAGAGDVEAADANHGAPAEIATTRPGGVIGARGGTAGQAVPTEPPRTAIRLLTKVGFLPRVPVMILIDVKRCAPSNALIPRARDAAEAILSSRPLAGEDPRRPSPGGSGDQAAILT